MTSELLYASPENTQIGRKDFVFMLQGKKGRCLFFQLPQQFSAWRRNRKETMVTSLNLGKQLPAQQE